MRIFSSAIENDLRRAAALLLAIWGIESSYGRADRPHPGLPGAGHARLGAAARALFRGELFDALTMVDRGYIDARTMTGSWAGAMGQTQFMPSSYLNYAVDFDGDGRRDIWKSTPDALASIANYLKGFGWNGDETWGREVKVAPRARWSDRRTIPKRTEGCYAQRNMTERVRSPSGASSASAARTAVRCPSADVPAGLVDVGERKFLVYPNYDAILGYNCAHYYALTVGLLGDALQATKGTKDGTTKDTKSTKTVK